MMCGIAGIIQLNDDSSCLSRIGAITARAAHRGPDGQGIAVFGKVALGHRRLAIIDLTEQGAQPMSDKNRMCHLTYNGEIYNYIEIREQLTRHGFSFQSSSDTEVLLKAYLHWGEDCVNRLNGMWSFAVLDLNQNTLFCSRDRFGEKPFYYYNSADAFYFASEIRQLLPELEHIKANRGLLERFLFGMSGEDVSETFFTDIQKLPSGHNLKIDLTTNQIQIIPYYHLEKNKVSVPPLFSEQLEAFGDLFSDSVRLRLRSDVSTGACLSGGLDSSSVVSLAAAQLSRASGKPLKAITAVSTDKSRDESEFARMVSEANRLDLHLVKPKYDQFRLRIGEIVRAQEEPFGTASIVMQFEVMRAAAENNIKVLLDGQGADELLLGYDRYFSPYLKHILRTSGAKALWQQFSQICRNNSFISPITLAKYYFYFNSRYLRQLRLKNKYSFMRLTDAVSDQIEIYAQNSSTIQDLQKCELTKTNLPALLRFEDKNAMWHSIETRLPYLDHRLVEFCVNLPLDSKINDGWTKYILRQSMQHRVPDDVIWRKNKLGFEAPQNEWVASHTSEMISDISSSSILKGLFQSKVSLRRAMKAPELLWKLYIVSLWEREFEVNDLA